ncbi:MAG: drug resistance transporter, Bcr/CflA subfamily [Sphingomonas bacterium]|nr:drug resistance transporter, Bcr/CflA subfamily [Sphingomonas bacterium]
MTVRGNATMRVTGRPARAPAPKVPLGLIAILGGLCAFAPLSVDMYLPGLPQMTRDLGAPASAGALTVGAFYLGMCLGQLLHGPISDRIGRRIPLLGGVTLYVLASIGCALAGSIEMLIACRFLQALGGCAGLVVSRAVVRDRFPPQQSAHVLSTLLLVISLGPIIAPLLGGFVLLVADWRAIFWILTAFASVIGIATFLRLDESRSGASAREARGESPFRSYWILLREPQVMAYALAAGCSHAGLLTYLAVSPEVLVGGFGISPQALGWLIAVNGVGLLAANYLNRLLLVRFSYDWILRRANLVSVAAAAGLLAAGITGFGGLWGLAVPLFVIVAAIGFTQPNAFAGAMAHDPQRAGAASGLVGTLQFGFGAIGAAIASALHDGTARPLGAVILCAYLVATVSLRMLGRGKR